MRAREFVIEQADYVHPSIFLAVKRARETGGKVVRSAGGYFKVVPQDAPGEEYEIDPTAPQRKRDLEQAAEAKRAEIKKNLTIYVHGDDNERYDALKAYNRGKRDLTQILKDIRAVVNYRPKTAQVSESQQLNEALLATMLGGWLAGRALNWLKSKITKTASSSIEQKIKENDLLDYIDRHLAAVLGSHKGAIGSVLTSFAMHLIASRAQPVEAALATVLSIANKYVKEYTGVATAQSVASNVGNSIVKGQADWSTIMQQLRRMEPVVDRLLDQLQGLTDVASREPAPIVHQTPPVASAQNDDPLAAYIN
jgi:hypothetical protein